MNKKIIIGILAVLIVAGLLLAGYFYWKKTAGTNQATNQAQKSTSTDPIKNAATQGVLPSINPGSNPLEKSPNVNPADSANPFKNAKTNPFQ
ncbi:MAG: hypothetical protein NUV83_02735 [Candidatus Wolfebacteria bacterium]|nr:hypothetical protein [Candidatus Wolfebacteria bacterium]